MRFVMRSKIHRATVTDADVDYVGSISIDSESVSYTHLRAHET